MKRYSLGFAFDAAGKQVVLIQKNRPSWQRGLLNGVGGHVEAGESSRACMVREFREETGVETAELDWRRYARLFSLVEGCAFEMHVFSLFDDCIWEVTTKTDEAVRISSVSRVLAGDTDPAIISNLPWLITAALDKHFEENSYFMDVRYSAE
jgi:8-oxo-dGTP diphosphatase